MQPHDILLLMTSLSQVSDAGQVTRLFVQALNDTLAPARLRFMQESPEGPVTATIPLQTLRDNFGMIVVDAQTPPSPVDLELLQTACRLLSVVLENLAQRGRLQSHRDLLWKLAADPMFVADPETGHILDANRAAEEVTGRSLDELRGMPFDATHPAEDAERYRKMFAAMATSETETTAECEFVRRDGSRVPVQVRASVETINDRKVVIGVFHDMSERKQAEEALHRNEQRSRLAQQASQTGVWGRNLQNDEVYWSDNVQVLFGMDRMLVKDYQAFLDTILPEDRERIGQQITEALANGVGFTIEYRIAWPDGSIRWLTEKAELFPDSDGQDTRLVGTVRDITERKRAEEELEKYRERLEDLVRERTAELAALSASQQLILDSVRATIWYKDTENNFIRVNKAAAELVGLSPKEIEGKSVEEIFPQGAAKYYRDDLEVIQSGKPKLGIVEPMRLPSGDVMWVLTDKIPIVNDAGAVTGIIVFVIDITERKQAQEKAERRSKELRTIVNAMAGRENRMAELKKVIQTLRAQIEQAGMTPVADDPLISGAEVDAS